MTTAERAHAATLSTIRRNARLAEDAGYARIAAERYALADRLEVVARGGARVASGGDSTPEWHAAGGTSDAPGSVSAVVPAANTAAAVEPAATRPAAPTRPPAAGRGLPPLPNLTDRDEEDVETNQRLAGWDTTYGGV